MPTVLRRTLATRIQALPALRTLLDDLSLVAGMPIRFLPMEDAPAQTLDNGRGDPIAPMPETGALCAHLRAQPAGERLCNCFRQKLRERATTQAANARCDAGLWEGVAPVAVGGQTVGHLLVAGCAGEPTDTATLGRSRHLLARAGVTLTATTLAGLRADAPVLSEPRREALMRVLQMASDRLALLLTEHLVTSPTALPDLVEQACRIVHAEYREPLRLTTLAERLGVSESHFSRTFHHATGLRFVDYVARFRAERARVLLLEADQPVTDVAHGCGFASVSQFNRVFKALFATSPRALRAQRGPLGLSET